MLTYFSNSLVSAGEEINSVHTEAGLHLRKPYLRLKMVWGANCLMLKSPQPYRGIPTGLGDFCNSFSIHSLDLHVNPNIMSHLTIVKGYKNLFLRKKSSWPRTALDLAWVEKGEVIPESAAPKSYFLFLSRTTIEILSTNLCLCVWSV